MSQESKITKKKTIYYDSSCTMCTTLVGKISRSHQKDNFESKNVLSSVLPSDLTQEAALKEIHVQDTEGKVYKNAEAILKILEDYPRWKFLAKVGQWPVFKQLFGLGYKFVAANRHFLFGPASRIFWVKVVLVLALAAGFLLSMPLWTGGRLFPNIPTFPHLFLPDFLETALFWSGLVLLFLTLISSKPQKFIFPLLGISAVFVFFDQMRLQPWFYQYVLMLGALGLFSWNPKDEVGRHAVLNTLRLVIASIYFFSGLQKLNATFFESTFPWVIEPVAQLLPHSWQNLPLLLGLGAPFIEMAIGIGLLSQKFRKYAVILALLMTIFILYVLGPLGHNWNSIVWPWNIAMILFVFLLFWKTDHFSFKEVLWVKNFAYQKLILALFVILPVFSFFNLWDSYLSASLYSGNVTRGQLFISDSVKAALPPEVLPYVLTSINGQNQIDLSNWSFEELNVPVYPEARIYKAIAGNFCENAEVNDEVKLIVNQKRIFLNGNDKETIFKCVDLSKRFGLWWVDRF